MFRFLQKYQKTKNKQQKTWNEKFQVFYKVIAKALILCYNYAEQRGGLMKLSEYINSHWDDTIRYEPEGNKNLIGLPYPYFVPSIKGAFQEMYYWDTYFAAKGLYICGKEEMVKNNANNMLYLIEKLGYMPNGSHKGLLGRSQPPLLSETIKDLYSIYKDTVWLSSAHNVLKKEYEFWMDKRITETGLNRYGFDATEENIPTFAAMLKERLKDLDFSGMTDREIVENMMCDAESGWDFNPRCVLHQTEYNYVDLNGILYGLEENMAYFAKVGVSTLLLFVLLPYW